MASSSLASHIKYDIFLSFRGTDTRRGFLSHLLNALNRKQIETFVDYKLEEGSEISPSLLKAIEESQISLIVFSKDYASSRCCLEELAKIIECMKDKGQIAIPIFYDVDPSHVRKQKESYHDALAEHEKTSGDKVQKWRTALRYAASLSGFDSSKFRNDAELVDEIVIRVSQRLNHVDQVDLNGLVGIHEPIAHLESLLHNESKAVLIVGLWGMGGIGKTTIASAVFRRLSYEFERCCFLDNVRDEVDKSGITPLKKKLLSRLLEEKDPDTFMSNGITAFTMRRLRHKKVLVVLDDVSDSEQLRDLCGGHDWFGPTSRIIVTTRDKQVLIKEADDIYPVKALNFDQSLQLFNLNAFKHNCLEREQLELSMRVVNYAKGIPLALTVLGSFLYGKSKEEWESELAKLKKMPNARIQNILRLSYDELDREERSIFLYLACFFKTTTEEQIKFLLDSCGYSTTIGLKNLQDKALISISSGSVEMHDLIREMGREVVREESMGDSGKCSRLWDPKDIYEVLKYKRGTEAIESITLNTSKVEVLSLHPQTFTRMYRLKFLKLCSQNGTQRLCLPKGLESLPDALRFLHWDGYPSKSLPLAFCPENLVEFIMPYSRLEKLWDGVQNLGNLKRVDLSESSHLIQLPDFSKASNLQEVDISDCKSLCQVPPSIVSSHKLAILSLDCCKELKSFQHNVHLGSLKELSFFDCTSLMEFSLTTSTAINDSCSHEEHSSLGQLDTSILPTPLEELDFSYCFNLSLLPDNISMLSSLKRLSLSPSNVRSLPASINHLSQLKYLDLRNCKRLQSLPEIPSSVVELIAYDCTSLETLFSSTAELIEEQERPPANEEFMFSNCIKLDELAINTLMANARVRIKRMAHQCLTTLEENEDGRTCNQHYYQFHSVRVSLPGREVPDWFRYRTTQTWMTIELLPHSRFLGFVFCFVLHQNEIENFQQLECDCFIEARNGGSVRYASPWSIRHRVLDEDQQKDNANVYLWYDGGRCPDIMKGTKESKASYQAEIQSLKVSFLFLYFGTSAKMCQVPRASVIKQCGVHPIYASDILNFGMGVKAKRGRESDYEQEPLFSTKKVAKEEEGNGHQRTCSSSINFPKNIWKILWNLQVPNKIKIFIWKCLNNAIPVKANLHRKHLSQDPLCPICRESPESIEHTILLCPWTQPVWFGAQVQFFPRNDKITRIEHWLWSKFQLLSENRDYTWEGMSSICYIMWSIWKGRNKFCFEEVALNPHLTLICASNLQREYNLVHSLASSPRMGAGPVPVATCCNWRPPPCDMVKLNVDAAFSEPKQAGAGAVVVWNFSGKIVASYARKILAGSSLEAEGVALRDSLVLAGDLGLSRILIESDCLEMVEACRGEAQLWEVQTILDDIQILRANFQHCGIFWVQRSANSIAHEVARSAMAINLPLSWVVHPTSLPGLPRSLASVSLEQKTNKKQKNKNKDKEIEGMKLRTRGRGEKWCSYDC